MNRTVTFINTAGFLSALLVLCLSVWARTGLPVYMTVHNYLSVAGLAAVLFILPDLINHLFRGEEKWNRSGELLTMAVLLLMGATGLFLPAFASWPGFVLIPAGLALVAWQFLHLKGKGAFIASGAGVILLLFLVFLFYSQDHHSLVFPERIILGTVHIDTLFHICMSNMFSTAGWASTGLNGAPYIPYHWGTHALFAGLKNWAGIDTMMFYNVAYPAIFIPLFIKSMIRFTERLLRFKDVAQMNILIAVAFLLFIYSLPFGGFQYASPMISESFSLSFIFMFLYGSTLLMYAGEREKATLSFLGYSLAVLIMISFFKISTGFICFAALAYLYFRVNLNLRTLLRIMAGGILLLILVYPFVYQVAYVVLSKTITERIALFWELSDGFVTYLAGAVIPIIVILKNNRLRTREDAFSVLKSGKYIDLEVLFVITVMGFLAGMFVSSNAPDVYYFCSIQLFLSIPYLILFSQRYFEKFRASAGVKTAFLFLVIILCVVSRPDIMKGMRDTILTKRSMQALTTDQQSMKKLIGELSGLDRTAGKKEKCIYIPQTEGWYYHSQCYRPLASPFVGPAMSGIAMICGIPDSILRSQTYAYSYYYYRNGRNAGVKEITGATEAARAAGYGELITFRSTDGILNKEIIHLKTHH